VQRVGAAGSRYMRFNREAEKAANGNFGGR